MRYSLSTAPASEPITTTEAKSHLRVDFTDDDTYIDTLIVAARRWCEMFTRRAFITQTWVLYLDEFPGGQIEPLHAPLQSVSSITYYDTAGTQQTWATSKYQVDVSGVCGRVVLAPGESYPQTQSGKANAVAITFVAGYGAASDVPASIKHAIKLLVGHWYENRESVTDVRTDEVPQGAEALLWSHRVEVAA